MPEAHRLSRFLISSSAEGDPQLIIELEDGSRLAVTASFEQIEDMADVLDEILDAADLEEEDDTERLPAFVRRDSSTP
ncbi:hypothetical protein KHP60_10805 [Microvirga sp. 3-52]|jgi:hypothetical protein|uniref:hypothetical protein n=1 Tax=Microvirga sp. 3-52 TaxID=2792425 RepID=UPI001ACECCF4|nr:hypothetical protein [Microvirga sp. 3-52]MBO1905009.1 hypothetical protein [Microvirga sp. 3-52]MBS7452821.1 hypothetical protein [Microvirga sp. 3-52]